jgi:hypothetical protein
VRKASRPRLPSTIAAKDHWRDNPTLLPNDIRDLFEIPAARVYKIRNELVKEKLMTVKKLRTKVKVKGPRTITFVPSSPPVVTPVIGEATTADDFQVGGNHYKEMGVPPWDVIESTLSREEFIGFLKGNIIKYSMRQVQRGDIDSNKCRHYIIKLDEMYKQWNIS